MFTCEDGQQVAHKQPWVPQRPVHLGNDMVQSLTCLVKNTDNHRLQPASRGPAKMQPGVKSNLISNKLPNGIKCALIWPQEILANRASKFWGKKELCQGFLLQYLVPLPSQKMTPCAELQGASKQQPNTSSSGMPPTPEGTGPPSQRDPKKRTKERH